MNTESTILNDERTQIANQSLSSIYELAHTLQGYIWESDLKLESKHDSVITALINQIKTECSEATLEKH